MEEKKRQSGDFLKDVEITISLRSGGTDISELKKLIQAFSASVTSLVDTKIVTTETEMKVKTTPKGRLSSISTFLYIE